MAQTAPYSVRPAAPADRPALVRLLFELQAHERAIEAIRTPPEEMAESHFAYLEEEMAAKDGCLFALEAGGAVEGFLAGWIENEPGTFIRPDYRRAGFVADLLVRPALRGTGAGRALLEAAEAHFRQAGVRDYTLFMLEANEAAGRFYEKAGFRPYERYLRKEL